MKHIILSIFSAAICIIASAAPAQINIKDLGFAKMTDMASTANGQLWMAVTAGGDNGNAFVVVLRNDKALDKWKDGGFSANLQKTGLATNFGQLWAAPDGSLHLFYTVTKGYYDGRGQLMETVCQKPGTATPVWSAPVEIGVGVVSGDPVLNADGSLVMPCALWGNDLTGPEPNYLGSCYPDDKDRNFEYLDKQRGVGVMFSSDGGKTWEQNLNVVKGLKEIIKARYNDPQIFQCEGGLIKMVIRCSGYGQSQCVVSSNGGKTWSRPGFFVMNPDRKQSVTRLSDGKLLLVKNNPFDNRRCVDPLGLYAYLSEDDGLSWYGGLRIDASRFALDPAVVETKDGKILVAFNYNKDRDSRVVIASTSVKEIDDACADSSSPVCKETVTAFVPGKAAAEYEAKMSVMTKDRTKWGDVPIRVTTYNIQANFIKKPDWATERMPALKALFDEFQFDIVGSQEPYKAQMKDLEKMLGKNYAWVGIPTKEKTGQYNPIFFRKDRFELIDWGTFWFTYQADKPGYDGYFSRNANWAHFLDLKTGKEFFFVNSHFDHRGEEAKILAAEIMKEKLAGMTKGLPVILTGDFNSNEDTDCYKRLLEAPYLQDALISAAPHYNAEYFSMSSYQKPRTKTGRHIDHIFYTPNSVKIRLWELIIKDYDGKYGSDHLPIFCDIDIAN